MAPHSMPKLRLLLQTVAGSQHTAVSTTSESPARRPRRCRHHGEMTNGGYVCFSVAAAARCRRSIQSAIRQTDRQTDSSAGAVADVVQRDERAAAAPLAISVWVKEEDHPELPKDAELDPLLGHTSPPIKERQQIPR